MPTQDDIATELQKHGLSAEVNVLEGFALYLTALVKWNRAINLTGLGSWKDILTKLVLEAFPLADFLSSLPLSSGHAPLSVDLGAGAGLPGIPLRLLWQTGSYLLLEKREKRAIFLRMILSRLNLPRTKALHTSCETYFAAKPGCADLVISKAFLPVPALLALVPPYLAPRGCVIVLANQAPRDFPSWELLAETSYTKDGSTHWFWCLTRANNSAPTV